MEKAGVNNAGLAKRMHLVLSFKLQKYNAK